MGYIYFDSTAVFPFAVGVVPHGGVQSDQLPQEPVADVEVHDVSEPPAAVDKSGGAQSDQLPQEPVADVEVYDVLEPPAVNRSDTQSSVSHLAVKSFCGSVSSRGRQLKRSVRAYSPTRVGKRRR